MPADVKTYSGILSSSFQYLSLYKNILKNNLLYKKKKLKLGNQYKENSEKQLLKPEPFNVN